MEYFMYKHKKIFSIVGKLAFLLGILSGTLLSGMFVWVNLEQYLYGFDSLGRTPIRTLKCPLILLKSETGKIRASFKNDLDRTMQFNLRIDLSTPTGIDSTRSMVSIDIGKTQQYEWEVSSNNITRHIFIFAKVFAYASYKMPFREASCGIWVVDIPHLTGQQFYQLLLSITLLGILIGQVFLEFGDQPRRGNRMHIHDALRFCALLVLLTLFACLQAWLIIGILLLIAIVVIVVAVSFNFLSQL